MLTMENGEPIIKGTDRPTLRYLNRYVKTDISLKWHEVGLELLGGEDDSEPALNGIRVNSLGDVDKCTTAMLQLWLERKPDASWNKLIKVFGLPRIGLKTVASKIEKILSKANEQQANSSTTGDLENQDEYDDDDDDDGDAQSEGKKKKKKSKRSIYPVISRSKRPCAIIINNQTFDSKLGLKKRSWSQSDVEKICTLEKEFGIRFNLHENQTAKQMKGVLKLAVDDHSTYSGLLLFIMTHGSDGDMLYGSDGELIALEELATIFEANNCQALKNKPKIFILHYCRGEGVDTAHPEGRGSVSKKSIEYEIPQKADFLFVHSTTDGDVAYGHEKKGFITYLVDAFTENLNENHLEDVLLIVKREVAKVPYKYKGKSYKQMPSVVSQMRDKVWFDKE